MPKIPTSPSLRTTQKTQKNPGPESIPTISAGEKSKALNLVSLEIDHPNLQKPSQLSSDLEILDDLQLTFH